MKMRATRSRPRGRRRRSDRWRWPRRIAKTIVGFGLVLGLFLTGPASILMFGDIGNRNPWWSASRDSSGQAPSPDAEPTAVVQVYGARTLGRRSAFGVHTWISTKRRGASHYKVHQVVGWRYYRGASPVVSQVGVPDADWFGSRPQRYVDLRGDDVERVIDQIEQAVADYPWANLYRVWPGPNSNTFVAHIARQVPALQLDLPPTAVGKDYLGEWKFIDRAPSATGWQVSIRGVLGMTVALAEGLEFNLLGLSAGIDFDDLALRIPGYGMVGLTGYGNAGQ